MKGVFLGVLPRKGERGRLYKQIQIRISERDVWIRGEPVRLKTLCWLPLIRIR